MERIALIGPMGSGKTTVGQLLAARAGWDFIDTDRLVVERAGMAIPEIFARHGEAYFRELEAAALVKALARSRVVVATGGGIVLRPENRRRLRQTARVFWLRAELATLAARAAGDGTHLRPLLAGDDPAAKLVAIAAERQPLYRDTAHVVVCTDGMSAEAVADAVWQQYERLQPAALLQRQPDYYRTEDGDAVVHVSLGERSYDVRIGTRSMQRLATALQKALPKVKNALVITDSQVGPLYLYQVLAALAEAGIVARGATVPAGEESKSLAVAGTLYTECVAAGLDRSSAVIALGGGVVGDLAGFVAATYMRGVAFVQIPTTLLAQVDASVGGKVAVDLPEGKNLVGAFHQPKLVALDLAALRSLSRRELAAGFAEVVKHAVIRSPRLFDFLHAEREHLLSVDPAYLQQMIAENVAIKARVVEADETEQGDRALLNFGHTIGHAYETVAGYAGVLHGEAVAAGMIGATMIAGQLGILQDAALLPRLVEILTALGLPVTLPTDLSPDDLITAMGRDKKAVHGNIRWVLPVRPGEMQITQGISAELVRQIVMDLQI